MAVVERNLRRTGFFKVEPLRQKRSAVEMDRRRRGLAVVGAVLLHLLAATLLIRPAESLSVDAPASTMEVSLAGPAILAAQPTEKRSPPTRPPEPVVPVPTRLAETFDSLPAPIELTTPQALPSLDPMRPSLDAVASVQAPAAAASGKPCAMIDALQTLLQTDPAVRDAISKIPVQKRSVAGAVVLWDAAWAPPQNFGGAEALGPIQAAIQQSIAANEPRCRNETVRGPRFFIIADGRAAIILALGSGEWRWADLLPVPVAPPTLADNFFRLFTNK